MTSLLSCVGAVALGFALLTTNGCGDARSATTIDSGARDSGTADINQPEANEMDGSTPDAGATVEGGGTNSCVSVTGGRLEPFVDLQIVGRQFDAYEGRRIRIVVASGGLAGRLGVAEVAIASGGFELTIPGAFDYSAYTEISLYVDDDADETCDVGEPLWGLVTGIVQEKLLVEVTPDGACLSGGGPSMFKGCRSWSPPFRPCAINFQADLEKRLPCPP